MKQHIESPKENKNIFLQILTKINNFVISNKVPLISSFVVALLSYAFAFTNKITNHDDMAELFGKGVTVTSGRWGLELLRYVFPKTQGSISLVWLPNLKIQSHKKVTG